MHICILSINYPTPKHQIHVFLDNLVRQFVDKGVTCTVISPQSSFSYKQRPEGRREFAARYHTEKGNTYMVYSPLYTVYPAKTVGKYSLSDLSRRSFYRAASRVLKEQGIRPDVIYAHFFQAGASAVMLGKELGVPVFIANGEADTAGETRFLSRKLMKETIDRAAGIISVSSKCRDEVEALCNGRESVMKKVTVIPNAADETRFHKMNRAACRKALGFPDDAFIVAFTGSFIERKGIRHVERAVKEVDGVKGIFIGKGELMPEGEDVLFCGRVENKDIPAYLNAADAFCLPTKAEGCCNALVEALCCGLPVISSDRSFNYDILDDSCAILVDPENGDEVKDAVMRLSENRELLEKLGEGSLQKGKELSLPKRADRILAFIRERA